MFQGSKSHAERFSRRQTIAASAASDAGPFSDRALFAELFPRPRQSRFSLRAESGSRFILRDAPRSDHGVARGGSWFRRLYRYPQRSSCQTHRNDSLDVESHCRRSLRNQFGRALPAACRSKNYRNAVDLLVRRHCALVCVQLSRRKPRLR